jgi:hypothetical protein
VAPGGTELTTPQVPRVYERGLSALKSGVNPGWSGETDTTRSETVGGGTLAASDKPVPLGGGTGAVISLAGDHRHWAGQSASTRVRQWYCGAPGSTSPGRVDDPGL